ncbi:MAG: tetratricopeptide repeat protein [Acidobacteria bacterium]|nr:tetratricopeptide repeat protein [Acidobacteriota bacterium]
MRCLVPFLAVGVLAVSSATAAADETAPSLIANGRVDDAIRVLDTRISASPNDALAHNLLCRAYLSIGQWDAGISECERAVSLEPRNGQFHLWLGRVYGEKADKSSFFHAAGLARKVRDQFEAAVHLLPRSVEALTDLAEFYLEAPGIVGGGRDKAERQANSLAAIDRAAALWVEGRIQEKRGDFSSAELKYRDAIEAGHGRASAWLNLGLFYKHRSNWDAMERALIRVRSAPLDRPDALVDAAELLIRSQRNLPEARELLRAYLESTRRVEQAPAFKVHFLLGSAEERLGNRERAASEYKAALSMAREFRPARQALERVSR